MAKPNYSFAKRQRDLAKEQKKEEKLQRKNAALAEQPADDGTTSADADAAVTPAADDEQTSNA